MMLVVTCLCYPKCILTECLTWLNDNCLLQAVGVVRWLDNGYATLGHEIFSLCHPALAICLRYYNRFQKDNLFYYAVCLMTRSIVVFILCDTLPMVIHYQFRGELRKLCRFTVLVLFILHLKKKCSSNFANYFESYGIYLWRLQFVLPLPKE